MRAQRSRSWLGLPAVALVVVGLAAGLAQPIQAQTVQLEAGCEGIITAQGRQCLVHHLITCEGLPEGHRWLHTIGPNGPVAYAVYDNQFDNPATIYPLSGRMVERLPNADDPLSLDELLETGLDSFSFEERDQTGAVSRVVGYDSLPGDTVTIDGRQLARTEFQYSKRSAAGEVTDDLGGYQYLDVELRVIWPGFFDDKLNPDESVDLSPVDFFYPGEAGFLAQRPTYECNSELVRFELPVMKETQQ